MQLRTVVGTVRLEVYYGYDPGKQRWGCPMRQRWGLPAHQKCSPALADRLCFTLTATGSYAQAAAVASKWGCPVDDSTLHALAQRTGARALEQMEERLKQPAPEREPQRAGTTLGIVSVDAWLVRFRGPGWGKKKTVESHVDWHEMKMGIYYPLEEKAQADNGRGLLVEKAVISWQGEAMELGRRLHWQAQAMGIGRAKQVLALADGANWCWNLIEQRWPAARQLLDFYHASQHLWEMGLALHQQDRQRAGPWVEERLHRLRHGQEKQLCDELQQLKIPPGESGLIVQRNQNYFASHSKRMAYGMAARRGWPIGSGAVASACRSRQCRFKRPGQFWTATGLRHLCALEDARHNGHWNQLWTAP